MGRLAAMRSRSAVIVTLLVSVVPARAASDDAFVTAGADGFHALSRIEEALALVPLTDDELAYITDPRTPRKARPTSSVRRRQLSDSEVSRSVEDPSAHGPGARENSSVKVESGDETAPKARVRSVSQEPDPRAIVDYELAGITEMPTPRKVPLASPAHRYEFPDTTVVSPPPIDDPGTQGRRAEENNRVPVEHGGESASPNTRGRSAAVEEEPDPRAVIDWLLKEYTTRLR
jgi:hypothetical protein